MFSWVQWIPSIISNSLLEVIVTYSGQMKHTISLNKIAYIWVWTLIETFWIMYNLMLKCYLLYIFFVYVFIFEIRGKWFGPVGGKIIRIIIVILILAKFMHKSCTSNPLKQIFCCDLETCTRKCLNLRKSCKLERESGKRLSQMCLNIEILVLFHEP